MLIPAPQGKRPEKLRFNLASLFSEDGMEYNIHEARARSMGLLGKKWAPPPPSELQCSTSSSTSLQSSGGTTVSGSKSSRNPTITRKGGFGGGYSEPTVTLATKEALADVFGMYNSPEKSMRFGPAAGSKYAPVRRVEPVTPVGGGSLHSAFAAAKKADENAKTPIPVFRDENANTKTPIPVFRDENAGSGKNAKENGVTPGASKVCVYATSSLSRDLRDRSNQFQVFIDPSSPSQTPGPTREGRRALAAKDPSTPQSNENARAATRARPAASAPAPLGSVAESDEEDDDPTPQTRQEEKLQERKVFSVFSAASATDKDSGKAKSGLSKKDVFVDAPAQPSSSKSAGPAAGQPFKVFSRPPSVPPAARLQPSAPSTANENAPRRQAFTPFRDTSAASNPPTSSAPSSLRSTPPPPPEPAPHRMPLGEHVHTPLRTYSSSSASTDSSDADGVIAYPMEGQYYDDVSTPSSDLDDVDDNEATPGDLHAMQMRMHAGGYADDALSDDVDERMHEVRTPAHSDAEDGYEYEYEYYEDEEEHQPGSGHMHQGRLGKLNLMTPITERTLEYANTQTLNARSTAGSVVSVGGKVFSVAEAVAKESADMLAAELREDEREEYSDLEDAVQEKQMEVQTDKLSLSEALTRAATSIPPNPCNPFEGPIIASLLSVLPSDSAFYDLRAHDSDRLDALQKFARKKERRSSGNSSRGSSGGTEEHSLRIELGSQKYDVLGKLGEGGFGAVFEAIDVDAAALKKGRQVDDGSDDDLTDDEDEDAIPKVALKVVKPRSIWEFHALRRIRSTVSASLRRSIVMPAALYAYQDESFLVLELRKQGTLLDIVNRAPAAGITQQGACLDELLVMFFAVELMRTLEGLHRAGFIHGDVKIDNCLLRLEDVPGPATAWAALYDPAGEGGWSYKGITLIDFGRTIDTKLFPAGQMFVGDWATDARDCFELREGRPWTFQTDYFGLAGIIFCMLYGKYIEAASVVAAGPTQDGNMRYKLATPFKRYWQGELWTRLFDLLLNPTHVRSNGSSPLCDEMAELRGEMETWLQANCNRASNSLKGLLKKVGLSILGGKDGR